MRADLITAKQQETMGQLEQFFRQKFLVQVFDKNLEATPPTSEDAPDGNDAAQK